MAIKQLDIRFQMAQWLCQTPGWPFLIAGKKFLKAGWLFVTFVVSFNSWMAVSNSCMDVLIAGWPISNNWIAIFNSLVSLLTAGWPFLILDSCFKSWMAVFNSLVFVLTGWCLF